MYRTQQQQQVRFPGSRGAARTVCFGLFAACRNQFYAESGCPMRMRQHAEQTNAAAARFQLL